MLQRLREAVVLGYILFCIDFLFVKSHAQTAAPITSSSAGSINVITLPTHWYRYEPKEDITAYELATIFKTILPGLTCRNAFSSSCDVLGAIEALPETSRRHFVRVDR